VRVLPQPMKSLEKKKKKLVRPIGTSMKRPPHVPNIV
jgi:hypothetical protein